MNTISLEFTEDSPLTTTERYVMLQEFLHAYSQCEVEFVKKDGEMRVMPCTIDATKIPAQPIKEAVVAIPTVNQSTITVWCTDKEAWRAFKTDNLRKITAFTS